MPEQPDDFELTEADIDMVTEKATGKPIKPKSVAAGITSMRQHIAELEAEKAKLFDRLDVATEDSEGTLHGHLTEINQDIATARERLAHYVSQTGQQN